MKRTISMILLLVLALTMLVGCNFSEALRPKQPVQQTDETQPKATEAFAPALWMDFVDETGTTYYCWEDGKAGMSPTYNPNTTLSWENDTAAQTIYVSNAVGVVAQYAYKTVDDVKKENEVTEPKQMLIATVFDAKNGITYYCWDDGSATTTSEWTPGFYTWTKPWNGTHYNIYNGDSNSGRVLYSERECDWCGNHLVYYLSYIRYGTDTTESQYLCESCHKELQSYYDKCSACGYYYVSYEYANMTGKCDKCAGY